MSGWQVKVCKVCGRGDDHTYLEGEIQRTLNQNPGWEPMNVTLMPGYYDSHEVFLLALRRLQDDSLIDPQDEALLESERERLFP